VGKDVVDKKSIIMKTTPLQIHTSAADALRESVVERIASAIEVVNTISDSSTRLVLQATCLDLLSSVEEVIGLFDLEVQPVSEFLDNN
jgi:hypothetical protein